VSLNVSVTPDWDVPALGCSPISCFVIPLIGRLKELVVEGDSVHLEPFLTLPKGTVEWLEAIQLIIHDSLYYPVTVFETAGRLRRVTLCHGTVSSFITDNPLDYRLPWAQLEDLELRHWRTIDADKGVALLRQCPSLVRCSLNITAAVAGPRSLPIQQPQSPIVLQYMKSLSVTIRLFSLTSANHILGPLILPSLIQMTLHGSIQWSSEVVAVLTLSGSLKMLTLGIPVPALEIDTIIRKAPSLELLHVPQSTFLASTLQLISSGEVVPKLDNLQCNVNEGMLDAHFDLLESRGALQSCTKITTVEFFVLTCSTYSLYHGGRAEKLIKQGWNIMITIDLVDDSDE